MIIKKLLFLMTCFLCGTIANAQTKGDVTGDGKVNDADIDEVVNIIMGDSANPYGDVNEDGRVNIGDIGAIVNIMMTPIPVPAIFYSDGIKYSISGDHVSVVSGDYEYQGDITIPERVTYYGVTYTVASIEGFAFYQCRSLKSVTIPSSVTSIGSSAFEECTALTSISLSDGLQIIGGSAFESCTALSAIIIPSSVNTIALNAFKNCSNLKNVTSEIQTPFAIQDNVFEGIASGAILTVPKGTKSAYQNIAGWNRFTNITDGTTEILTKRTIHVATAGTLPQLISEYEKYYIEELTLTGELNGTDFYLIRDMAGAVSVVKEEFDGETIRWAEDIPTEGKLKSINLAESRIVSGGGPYYYEGERKMTGSAWIEKYYTNSNEVSSYLLSRTKLESIVLPNSVTSIGSSAFSGCSGLASITIPNTVTSIGTYAFYGTAWYENQPDGLVYAAKVAYKYKGEMPANTNVSIVSGTLGIAGSAFYHCGNLNSVIIPNSVMSIGYSSFHSCSGLKTVTSEIEKPFEIDSYVFEEIPSDAELIVPKGTKALYQATEGWNKFTKITEAADKDEALFTIDGITYEGTKSAKTVVVKSVDASKTWLEVPASISYDGITYQVTGVADNALNDCSMGSLIWNVEAALPNNAFNNASIGSNFLLYVKSADYAPSSVKNVVVNGMAQTIVLSDDGGQFYCPQAFTARTISYTHNYSMETGGNGKGWETIALPFDVMKITHSTRGEIVPFPAYNSSSNQKPFWLAIFSGSGFRRTAAVLANEPYIIAMPNSTKYQNNYNLAGDVTFSSENIQVPKTPSFSGTFVPSFATVAKSSSVYALNVNNRQVKYTGSYDPGSRFISGLRDIRPFEAYMTGNFTRGIIEIGFDDNTTDMDDILTSTDVFQEVTIHTLSGQQVARTTQRDFDAVWQQLPKGVYIVRQAGLRPQGGKKMIR